MAKNDMFGWDLLYKLNEPVIRNHNDIIICLVHWTLIHQGFYSAGIGEDTTVPCQSEYSETLPEGWSCPNASKYNLRYVRNGKLYILSAFLADHNLVINLNRIVDSHASGTCININEVKAIHGAISEITPNYKNVISAIETELIQPMLSDTTTKEMQTQTQDDSQNIPRLHNESQIPHRVEPSRSESFVPTFRDIHVPARPLHSDPLGEVGRSDLDPLGSGGGMLIPSPGFGTPIVGSPPGTESGIVPGSVPPGARFDPFRPPPREPRPPTNQNPDHDHMSPPGYEDMFM